MAEQRVGLCQQTFVADDKFGDVIACLEARGWARVICGGDLAWRNLKQTDFESADADRYVNHLRHAQRLSHKATLAAALADASAEFYPRCYDLRLPAQPKDVKARSNARTCNFLATAESSTTKTQGVRGVSEVCRSKSWSNAFARSLRSAWRSMSNPRNPPALRLAPTPSASFKAEVTGFVPDTAQGP